MHTARNAVVVASEEVSLVDVLRSGGTLFSTYNVEFATNGYTCHLQANDNRMCFVAFSNSDPQMNPWSRTDCRVLLYIRGGSNHLDTSFNGVSSLMQAPLLDLI